MAAWRLARSVRDALAGFVAAVRSERNLRIHLAVLVTVIGWAGASHLLLVEWGLLLLVSSMVIAMELMNTAIEAAVDYTGPEAHPLARLAKHTAAAGVLVSAAGAVAVGALILAPWARWEMLKGGLHSPWGLMVLAGAVLILIAVRWR